MLEGSVALILKKPVLVQVKGMALMLDGLVLPMHKK
jgi:hypothetical protein